MKFNNIECGERIKKLCLKKGISQERLACELNINRSHMSNIERGNKMPSLDLFVALADFFDVSLDFLILGRENDFYPLLLKQEIRNIIKQLLRIEKTI